MSIVNPTGANTSGLLKQILAEKDESLKNLPGSAPSAVPGAPLRQVVEQPTLQPESPESARVAAVKPLMGAEATSAIPPQSAEPGGAGNIIAGQGVVAPLPSAVNTAPVAAPSTPGPSNAPAGQNPTAPASVAAPAPAPQGKVLGASTRMPGRTGLNRLIVDLPTKLRPRSTSMVA